MLRFKALSAMLSGTHAPDQLIEVAGVEHAHMRLERGVAAGAARAAADRLRTQIQPEARAVSMVSTMCR